MVTDAGGFGVLLADSVDTYRMNLTDFSPETIKKFKENKDCSHQD